MRRNGERMTVRDALEAAGDTRACYECGKEISSFAIPCPACGAPPRVSASLPVPIVAPTAVVAVQPITATSALNFHVAREGKHFGPFTEVAAQNYLAEGKIRPDDLCWRPGMETWLPVSQVLRLPLAVVARPRVGNQSNAVAGCLGLLLGPVGLWYKGHWAAGFAWLAAFVIMGVATGGVGIVFAPVFWIGMAIHAMAAEPRA